MLRGRTQKLAEVTENIRSNSFLFIGSDPESIQAFASENVEVVEPKIYHHLLQLTRTFESTEEPRLSSLFYDNARPCTRCLSSVWVEFPTTRWGAVVSEQEDWTERESVQGMKLHMETFWERNLVGKELFPKIALNP